MARNSFTEKQSSTIISELAEFLLQDDNDAKLFYEKFYNEEKPLFFSLASFREYKIKKINIPEDDFTELIKKDVKKALEIMYQEPVDNQICELLNERLTNGVVSPSDIYNKIMENRFATVGRLLHLNNRRAW